MRQLGAEAVVGEKSNGASSQRDVFVDQNVGGALGGEFGRRHGVHVCAPAESVGEKKNVGIPLGSDWEGAEIVNADEDAGAVWYW